MHSHPADPAILAHCVAIVRASNEADGEALMRLAEKLRFGSIRAHSVRLAPHSFDHRLVFFLVHFDFDVAARLQVIKAARQSGSVSLSFAPVILFLREAKPDEVQANIELGFDDVINVPEDGRVMATRLASQIDREHLYIETRNYLGPDRHRLDHLRPVQPNRPAEEPHARLTILRTVEHGVQIVKRQEAHKPH
jgi:hypothetical protein